jgi:hypothetical protein
MTDEEFDFDDVNTSVRDEVNQGLMELGKETRKLRKQMKKSSRVQWALTAAIVLLSAVQLITSF